MTCPKCRGETFRIVMEFSLSVIVQCLTCKETFHKIKWRKQA